MHRTTFLVTATLSILCGLQPAFGQAVDPTAATSALNAGQFGTVMVYLRTEDGQLLPRSVTATLQIVPLEGGAPLGAVPRMTGDGWLFTGIAVGNDYKVQIVASGYLPAQEHVRLSNTPGAESSVIVLLHPLDQELAFQPPTGQFVLAPRAEKEIQHALQDLQSGKAPSAQKHAQAAIGIAPDNPYVQYVMGLSYLLVNRVKEAKPYLEKSVSTDPRRPQSLRALGTVRYRLGDNAGAIVVLSKAVQIDDTSWKAEWLLASSYLAEKQFAEARNHAEQALKIGKGGADSVKLVLGAALANLGEREKAAALFDTFVVEFPRDPNTPNAVKWAKLMREPIETTATLPVNLAVSVESVVEVPPRPDWAPADIDALKPFVISDAACALPLILEKAGANAERLVSTLQEFSATEDVQEVEIKRSGQLEKPSAHKFNYLVFIEQVSPRVFDVKESRNQGADEVRLPGRLQDTGAPALGLAFHPIIQPDLDWKCEGLGTWDNQPAWVLHFQQKPKQPNVLAWFATPTSGYSLPLKGRAWVAESSGQVLHLETDLMHGIEPVGLRREHFSVDYKQVFFHTQNVDLWLPENVDSYFQYQGHFLHYYHHFSDFKLFWVGTSQKINDPKAASQPAEQPQRP